MSKNQQVATHEPSTGSGVAQRRDQLPAYMKQDDAGLGSENVGAEDLVIPRLEIAQALSPALDESHAAYIPDAKQGDIYNSVTREVYGPRVHVVPVFFRKEFLVWRDRKKGGGFRGSFLTFEQAEDRIREQEIPEEYEAIDTAQHFVLVLREDGSTEQAVISMSRTKMKISRNWNSLIRLKGGARFSHYYIVMSADETNSQNQKYKNFALIPGKYAPEAVYNEAKAIYTALQAGKVNLRADEKFDTETEDAGTDAAGSKEY